MCRSRAIIPHAEAVRIAGTPKGLELLEEAATLLNSHGELLLAVGRHDVTFAYSPETERYILACESHERLARFQADLRGHEPDLLAWMHPDVAPRVRRLHRVATRLRLAANAA